MYSTFSLALRDIGQGPGAARGDEAPRAGGLGGLDSPSGHKEPLPPPSSSRLPLRLPRQQPPPPRPLRGESCCPPSPGAAELEPGGSHSRLTPRACRAGAAERAGGGAAGHVQPQPAGPGRRRSAPSPGGANLSPPRSLKPTPRSIATSDLGSFLRGSRILTALSPLVWGPQLGNKPMFECRVLGFQTPEKPPTMIARFGKARREPLIKA